jgi:hypothetical protein
VFLSKKEYYKRRWFLAILFLLMGLLLLYLSYGIFSYNKNKSELITKNSAPSLIMIEKIRIGDSPFVALAILNDEKKKVSTVINDSVIDKLAFIFQQPTLNRYSFGSEIIFDKNIVNDKQYSYSYSKNKLYELKIDGIKVIEYKKKSHFLGYLVLVVALVWIGFQIWVIYILATRGISVYDDFYKKK